MSVKKNSLFNQADIFQTHFGLNSRERLRVLQPIQKRLSALKSKAVYVTTLLSGTILSFLPTSAFAQSTEVLSRPRLFSSADMATYAVGLGVMGAALFAVIILTRHRSYIETENNALKTRIAESNQDIEKYKAIISDKSRRIIIWENQIDKPEILGELPSETGAPLQYSEFLAFGKWLKPNSASSLEKALDTLRSSAQTFDLTVETQRNEILEVQGRVSGGKAFARFVALNNLRAELASLNIEREQLIAALSTFENLLDNIEQPVWRRDLNGNLIWINHAYAQAVDLKDSQSALKEQHELLSAITREKIKAAATPNSPFADRISTVVAGNRTFLDVVDVKTQYGSAGIAIDSSEAETVREELKRVLKSHADTLDHLAAPVAIFDGNQRLQFYNQAFASLWSFDLVFLESKPDNSEIFDRLRAESKLPAELNWKNWKETALSVYRSLDTKTDLWHLPNGQTLRVISTAHPQGGATWVFENLTEQVNLQARYNTLVTVQGETIDHLSEGVAVFGADGRISISNPAFRAIWGITAEDAASGTHVMAVASACERSYDKPDGWKFFCNTITSFEDARDSQQGTLELLSGLVLDYAIIPLPDSQTMLTFVNKTDSVRAERALQEKNEALQLAHSLKNDFVHHVSYELRSPLTNIIGFTDLLKTPEMGHLNDRQAEYLDHISTSSAVLLTYVNDILDLATLDAGIMQLNYSDRDLNSLLDNIAETITTKLQESGVLLEIFAPPHLGKLVADHQRLKQILIKLLNNATNFAPEGSTIKLTCQRIECDFLFTVEDDGPGIPEDILGTIFDRFSSHGNGGRRTGAGLGLSIVERFVKLHEGQVSIKSMPGKGTIVSCYIPNGKMQNPHAAE